jgi:DNA-binding LytR/AlgR family response regulator
MLRVILIDDEKPALEELKFILEQIRDVEVIGAYNDPVIGLEQVNKMHPDVVFLDIAMPEMDGFTVAQEIVKIDASIHIVFATAFDEYAIKAFEVNAVDYILKPFFEKRLEQTIDRIQNRKKDQSSKVETSLEKMLQAQKQKKVQRKMAVWKKDRIVLLTPEDIIYCTVDQGETILVTAKGKYRTEDTLSVLEKSLEGQNFFRCHRSFLINIDQIDEIIPWFNNTYAVKMNEVVEEIPVSRRQMKEFKELLNI